MEEEKKKVDEAWKDRIEKERKEKEAAGEQPAEETIEADFGFFISTLALQASIALGAIANPVTQKKEENMAQAKLIIDTLGVLKEKTKGNLSTEEDGLLENVLYELRTLYIAKMEGTGQ
ncbi:MAG: DUF1844 domain-containing protein [Candidatus Omnitrophica bacterium]|nr:DUF1844 domain-containing protein [Candidatus Omnitrophota bacterium]